MQVLLIDGITEVSLHNGVVRGGCVSGPPNAPSPSGTLLIPANVAGAVAQGLVNALAELDKKIREQAEAAKAAT